MLLVAKALALLGIFPADRVAKIREGTGSYDTAQDALALVALDREHATTVAGKHPFTDADFAAAEEAGTWLVEHITPAGGRAPTPDPAAKEAARVRDQFWALVRDRYVHLFRAGSYYTDRVAQFVPPRQSRVVVAKPDGEIPSRRPSRRRSRSEFPTGPLGRPSPNETWGASPPRRAAARPRPRDRGRDLSALSAPRSPAPPPSW